MSSRPIRILVVDDDEDVLQACTMLFEQSGMAPASATSPADARIILGSEPVDVVLVDLNFRRGAIDGAEGLDFVSKLRETWPGMGIIVFSAYSGISLAVAAMRLGSDDFVIKPWRNQHLVETVAQVVEKYRSKSSAIAPPRPAFQARPDIIGKSGSTEELRRFIAQAAQSDATVLVSGGAGLGKTLVARQIHERSGRPGQPLIEADLRTDGHELLASAADGLTRNPRGATLLLRNLDFLEASGATLIEALLAARVRVISTTRADTGAMADSAFWSAGLLYRLATLEVHLSPLEDRPDDYAAIVEYYLKLYAHEHGSAAPLSKRATAPVSGMVWPGGIRQLKQFAERSILLQLPMDQLVDGHLRNRALQRKADEEPTLAEIEHGVIKRALTRNRGNVMATARELGVSRAALYRRLKKHQET